MGVTEEEAVSEACQALDGRVAELTAFFRQDLDFGQMVYRLWTAKDVLGHLTFWHESFARNLGDLAAGRSPSPLKGKLSEVNEQSVTSTRDVPVPALLKRLAKAQRIIRRDTRCAKVGLIPYRQGSRPYSRLEHLQVVHDHIGKHLRDLRDVFAE